MHDDHQRQDPAETRLRLDLGYDGTAFAGWAKQPGLRTVQGELERALSVIIRRPAADVSVTVAGRTDAGVHARGQVCHWDVTQTELERLWGRSGSLDAVACRINGVLKRHGVQDVIVYRVTEAPSGFDARFGALSRRYEYRVRPAGERPDPLDRTYTVNLTHGVDLAAVQDASQTFLGLQDFSSFCKAREGSTAVRTVLEFGWLRNDSGVLVGSITADAFCHSMVRSLVGAVIGVGAGKLSLEELVSLTEARSRSSKITVMPPHGLSLEHIEYPEDSELESRALQTRARRDPLS